MIASFILDSIACYILSIFSRFLYKFCYFIYVIRLSNGKIFPASYAGVAYLEKHLPKNKRVFVIGEQGDQIY